MSNNNGVRVENYLLQNYKMILFLNLSLLQILKDEIRTNYT